MSAISHDALMEIDGTIVAYDADKKTGVINAHDGKTYNFEMAEWPYPKMVPEPGLMVTFETAGTAAFKIRVTGRVILMK
jgi:hypothetical protein